MPKQAKSTMRRFQLHRDIDESGVSGTGIVAEGCEFSDGIVALTFLSNYHAVEVIENMKTVEQIHGHNGKTRVVFIDK